MKARFSIVILASALTISGFGFGAPTVRADEPRIPVASMSNEAGVATLKFHSSPPIFYVEFTLQPGSQETRGDLSTLWNTWMVATYVRTEAGVTLGCYNGPVEGKAGGTIEAPTYEVRLHNCDGTMASNVPPNADLVWSFLSFFSSSTQGTPTQSAGKIVKTAIVQQALAWPFEKALVNLLCGASGACALSFTITTLAAAGVSAFATWQNQDANCDSDGKCTTLTRLLGDWIPIEGGAGIGMWFSCSDSGRDTWNFIEAYFWNQDPNRPITTGFVGPYDSGQFCVTIQGQASVRVEGSISDSRDITVRNTEGVNSFGDGTWDWSIDATASHGAKWSGTPLSGGLLNREVYLAWDFEAKEPGERFKTLTMYDDGAILDNDLMDGEKIANPFGFYDTVYLDFRVIYMAMPSFSLFDSENPMQAEGKAVSITANMVAEPATRQVSVWFDVVPMLSCTTNCPPNGGGILEQVIQPIMDVVCPGADPGNLNACLSEAFQSEAQQTQAMNGLGSLLKAAYYAVCGDETLRFCSTSMEESGDCAPSDCGKGRLTQAFHDIGLLACGAPSPTEMLQCLASTPAQPLERWLEYVSVYARNMCNGAPSTTEQSCPVPYVGGRHANCQASPAEACPVEVASCRFREQPLARHGFRGWLAWNQTDCAVPQVWAEANQIPGLQRETDECLSGCGQALPLLPQPFFYLASSQAETQELLGRLRMDEPGQKVFIVGSDAEVDWKGYAEERGLIIFDKNTTGPLPRADLVTIVEASTT